MKYLFINEDNLFEWDELNLGSNESFVNDATITYALKDLAGTAVLSATGSLSYIAGSDGLYQGTMESTVAANLTEYTEYSLELTATSGTKNGFRKIPCLAVYHKEGDG